MVKTVSHKEHLLLRAILKDYYTHLNRHNDSLLCRFVGCHKITFGRKASNPGKFYFVVMANVFQTNLQVGLLPLPIHPSIHPASVHPSTTL